MFLHFRLLKPKKRELARVEGNEFDVKRMKQLVFIIGERFVKIKNLKKPHNFHIDWLIEGIHWNDMFFQRFSKCIGCDPNFAFKDQSIIPTCKVGKTGLHECKLKCSGHGFIKGNDKTRIFCRCPKNQGKGKNCSWYHDGKKEKLKRNIEQSTSHYTAYNLTASTCECM